jgi:hypothetical protein
VLALTRDAGGVTFTGTGFGVGVGVGMISCAAETAARPTRTERPAAKIVEHFTRTSGIVKGL